MISKEQRDKYVTTGNPKSSSGRSSLDCGDAVALALRGRSDEDLGKLAVANGLTDQWDKWSHLNAGQRRMSLGNVLRAMVKRGQDLTFSIAKVDKHP